MERILVIYLFAVNLLAFILYGIDKKRARNRGGRSSERTLIGIEVIGAVSEQTSACMSSIIRQDTGTSDTVFR